MVPSMPAAPTYARHLARADEMGIYSNFGPLSRELEAGIARELGLQEETIVACSSATAGLSAALIAAGVKGKVLVPAFTFPASLGAVRAANLEAHVVDVDPETWAISADIVEQELNGDIGAVMLVAPFGMHRDFGDVIAACTRRGVSVVIDSAASLGTTRPDRIVNPAVFEVFSLHATKTFAVGEGGIVACHASQGASVRSALNFALIASASPVWGFNGKLSELHAAVGLAQLEEYRTHVAERKSCAAAYIVSLVRFPELELPLDSELAPWQCFPILFPSAGSADEFERVCAHAGLEIRRYYRPSLSSLAGVNHSDCRTAERLSACMCALPVRSGRSLETFGEILKIVVESMGKCNFSRVKV